MEAADNLIPLIVCITEWIPVLDMVKICAHVRTKGVQAGGAELPGDHDAGLLQVGHPSGQHLHARAGRASCRAAGRSPTRSRPPSPILGIGQSTCVGIGGDPIIGSTFIDILALFQEDPETEVIALIGEIGGSDEEEAAAFITSRVSKPVVGFVAGKTAPPDRRMGHAGAIVSAGRGTAAEKIAALQRAGVTVGNSTDETAEAIATLVGKRPAGV